MRVAVRPLYIRHISNLSPPSLRPRIVRVVLELDLAATSFQEVGDALELLASLPNLQRLEVKSPDAGNAPRGKGGMTDEMLVQSYAPLAGSASLRELRTSCAYRQCDLQTLVQMSQLTLLAISLSEVTNQDGECECVTGLSSLQALHIESNEPPQGLVTQLTHLEQLRWSTSSTQADASLFLASLTTLPMLPSLDVTSAVHRVYFTPDDVSPILQLTNLTCLSIGLVLTSMSVCCLDVLSGLAHLKIDWRDDRGFNRFNSCDGLRAIKGPLGVAEGFRAIHDRFSPLSRLTRLTHLELVGDDTIGLGWADLECGEFTSREEGRIPLESLRTLGLNGPWLNSDTVSHILAHVPLLTSFTTSNVLHDETITVLAGMTRLRALSFVVGPLATEGGLLKLTSLSWLSHLTCTPIIDDPKIWPTSVTPAFVATMEGVLSNMGGPISLDFKSPRRWG